MFDIEYKGGNAVLISTKEKSLLIDGNLELLGLKNINDSSVVNIATEKRFLPLHSDNIMLEGPGEYEVGPFSLRGIPAKRMIDSGTEFNSTLYRIEVGEISIGVLGNITMDVSDDQLEALGVVDILILPVGGNGYTLDATDAVKLVKIIEPKLIIPVHYNDPAVTYEVPQESSERFEKELGLPVEVMSKFKVKGASSLPASMTLYKVTRS